MSTEHTTASDILIAGAEAIDDRAASRDLPDGERTMGRAVATFNAWRANSGPVTETEGWIFMVLLKLCRGNAGTHNLDDYIDAAAYVALAGEHAERTKRTPL